MINFFYSVFFFMLGYRKPKKEAGERELEDWLKEIYVKKGVDISKLKSEIKVCLKEALDVHKGMNKKLLITSTYEGVHMEGSKHYQHQAFDSRIWYLSIEEQDQIVAKVKARVGDDYDIIREKDHIHNEYDKK